ncbi:MAG: hypothetical protein JF607_17500 [Burkholderiales bacterium]|jgi:hypothetical protein|nr:hypothetical protein [Burkholderiales bacterium]
MTQRALIPVTNRGYVVGEHHHRAKLTDHDVELILALRNENVSQAKVAEKFECSRRTVRDIESGRYRSARPDGYRQKRPPRSRERERQLASRWPSRIKPAKASEFELIPQSETACAPPQAVSENAL